MNTTSKIVCIFHIINHKSILYKFLKYINKEFFEIINSFRSLNFCNKEGSDLF